MDTIKKNIVLLLLFFTPFVMLSQKSKFPKDTIYILFDKKEHTKEILNDPELGKNLYFKNIDVYYDYKQKADTLCILHLKDYKFSNLKEIREKEINWVDRKFKGSKYKPYSGGGSRNSVFHTYLIEVISEEKFVIYPVIWADEGAID
jgi:hypothetical protein